MTNAANIAPEDEVTLRQKMEKMYSGCQKGTDHYPTHIFTQGKKTMNNPDPWAHRSISMRCSSCMWFVRKAATVGRCRRHAPTMNGYPVVFQNDWCGDHKLDECSVVPKPVMGRAGGSKPSPDEE